MDNNKQRKPQVNKCAKCDSPTIDFIWTTSATINPGIKVMYPKVKLCRKCYEDMKKIYPPCKPQYAKCPHCGGKIKSEFLNKVVADDEPYCNHEYKPKTLQQEREEAERTLIIYCDDCGYILGYRND